VTVAVEVEGADEPILANYEPACVEPVNAA
jgi:hypothetical protein